jgi:hypothetical protein
MPNKTSTIPPSLKPKFPSYNEQTRISHVRSWKASGLTLSQYSQEQGILVSTLSKWIKRYDTLLEGDSFKEVALTSGVHQPSYVNNSIEIKLTNGVQIRLPLNSGIFNLEQLLKELSRCN